MRSSDPKGATMSQTIVNRSARELSYRSNDGLEVWLLWSKPEGRLFVLVVDSKTGDSFEIDVDSDRALDAFEHPYAYAAWRGVEYTAPGKTEPVYA
jgi:hypothetical protein